MAIARPDLNSSRSRNTRTGLPALFAAFFILNLVVVLILPMQLGYPAGGRLLLNLLPVFSAMALLLAVVTPLLISAIARRWGLDLPGFLAKALFVAGMLGLAVANGYLWILCVESV